MNPACPSLSPGAQLALRSPGAAPGSDLRPTPGTNLQARTTARCRASQHRGLPGRAALRRLTTSTTLPRDGYPPSAPLVVAFLSPKP